MDYSQLWTLIGGIIGGGIGGTLLNRLFDRRKDKATAAEAGEKARGAALANEAAEIQQILGYTKSLKDFVRETEENTRQINILNQRVASVEKENSDLKAEIKTKQAIIEYQKEERHEWTQSLMGVQEKLAESKLEIKTLKDKVAALEQIEEDRTKLELREPK